jgi:hypothetical protein
MPMYQKISQHTESERVVSDEVLNLVIHVDGNGLPIASDVACSSLLILREQHIVHIKGQLNIVNHFITTFSEEFATKINHRHPAVDKSRNSNLDVIVLSLGLFSDETKGTMSARANMYETCSLVILNTSFEFTQSIGGTILLTCTNGVKPLPLLNVFVPSLRELENGMKDKIIIQCKVFTNISKS